MFLIFLFFLSINFNFIRCSTSNNLNSWSLVESYAKHWLSNWVLETELKYDFLSATNVSSQCYQSLKQYALDLKSFEPNAVQMFDSSGKIPSGLLQGSWTDLGAFDECLALPSSQYCFIYSKVPMIRSQRYEGFFQPYSQSHYKLNHNTTFHQLISHYGHYFLQMNITTGLCLPLGCSTSELRNLITSGLTGLHQSGLQFDLDLCQTHSKPVPWETHEIIAAFVIISVLCANIIGSISSPSLPILRHFNVASNLSKVIASPLKTPFPCLGGIKSLTMIYLICGHVVWGLLFSSFVRLFALPSTLVNPLGLSILLGPNTVETFFLVSGLEMMTLFLDKSHSSLLSSKSFSIATFLFFRWLRFTVTIGWFVCINIMVFSDHARILFGGPFWYYLQSASSISFTCASTWLNHLLLVAHFFNSPENWKTCLMADWYLEIEFIYVAILFLILTPFLTKNKPFLVIASSILIIVLGTAITILVTIKYDVQTSWLPTNFVSNQFTKYLVYIHSKPWTHVSPFFIGVILAFIISSEKHKLIHKRSISYGWLTFWICVFIISFYEISSNINLVPINRSFAVLYGSTFRLIWSLFVGWLIYACHYSLTWSWVESMLCSRFLGILSRLNLNALFANFLIVRLNNATQRSLINLSLSTILFNYNGPIILQTYLISIVFTVLVDKPITRMMINSLRKHYTTTNDHDDGDKQKPELPLTVN